MRQGSRAPPHARSGRDGRAGRCATLERGAGPQALGVPALGRRRWPRPGRDAGCRWRCREGEGAGAWRGRGTGEPASAGRGHWRRAGGGCGLGDWGRGRPSRRAGGRRRSAALGTDLLTHISRRGHGARGPGAPPVSRAAPSPPPADPEAQPDPDPRTPPASLTAPVLSPRHPSSPP